MAVDVIEASPEVVAAITSGIKGSKDLSKEQKEQLIKPLFAEDESVIVFKKAN